MVSNHTGKVIKTIKILKSKVSITFTDNEKLLIAKETYASFYLYPNKQVCNAELKKIKEMDALNKYLSLGISIGGKAIITEAKLIEKLKDQGASDAICKDVIKIMKVHDLISDEGYILDYLIYGEEQLLGENKIKDNLIKKGIPSQRVNKLKFPINKEISKALQLLPVLEKRYQRFSYSLRKQKIYQTLLCKGYNKDVASKAVLSVKKDEDDKLLSNELKTAVKRWLSSNQSKYDNNKACFDALSKYLKRKGYSYGEIKKAWEDNNEFND